MGSVYGAVLYCPSLHRSDGKYCFFFKALANREVNVFVRDSTVCLIPIDIFLKSCDCIQLSSV